MNSAARPVLDFSGSGTRTTTNIHISKFAIDGGGDRMTQLPSKYNGNVGYGGAVLVQSSNSSVTDVYVKNAWDNGISFYQLGCADGGHGQQCNTFPKNVSAVGIVCENNGIGEQSGFAGSCVGALTAQNALIADSVDYSSAVGFHLDFGGAAQAVFKNLKAYNNHLHGYWIGSTQGYFENIEAHNTIGDHRLHHPMAGHALILDRFASARGATGNIKQIGVIKNFKSSGAGKSGMVVAASGWKIENAEIISPNQLNQSYSAILGVGDSLEITGLSLGVTNTDIINPVVKSSDKYPYHAEYGYDEEVHVDSCISMNIKGGAISARLGQISSRVGKRLCSNQTVDVKKIEDLITNIFLDVLKRAPRRTGLDYYVQQFLSGKSMVDIKAEINFSDEAQCLQSGGIFNITNLNCTCPEGTALFKRQCKIIVLSYEQIVKKIFLDILKREPIQAGLEYYVGLLKSGSTEQSIRNEIYASAEAQCLRSGRAYQNNLCR